MSKKWWSLSVEKRTPRYSYSTFRADGFEQGVGEAFVRTDMLLNNKPGTFLRGKKLKPQNPKAIFRKEDEVIKVSSIENMPPVFEDSVKRLG